MAKIIIRPSRNAGKGKPSYAFYFIGQALCTFPIFSYSFSRHSDSNSLEAFLISAATIGMLVLPVGVVPAVPLYLTARYADLRRDASGIFFSTLCGIIVHLFFLMILMAIMYFIAVLWAIPFPKDLLLECAISAAYASPVALVCSLMVSFALPRPD
jgi:hypothetical protein